MELSGILTVQAFCVLSSSGEGGLIKTGTSIYVLPLQ